MIAIKIKTGNVLIVPTGTTLLTIWGIDLVASAPQPKGYPADPKTLGEYFKQYRLDNDYTAFEVSLELGVYESTIYKWEQGESYPRKDNIQKIIEFMGYDPKIHKPLKTEHYELI